MVIPGADIINIAAMMDVRSEFKEVVEDSIIEDTQRKATKLALLNQPNFPALVFDLVVCRCEPVCASLP